MSYPRTEDCRSEGIRGHTHIPSEFADNLCPRNDPHTEHRQCNQGTDPGDRDHFRSMIASRVVRPSGCRRHGRTGMESARIEGTLQKEEKQSGPQQLYRFKWALLVRDQDVADDSSAEDTRLTSPNSIRCGNLTGDLLRQLLKSGSRQRSNTDNF